MEMETPGLHRHLAQFHLKLSIPLLNHKLNPSQSNIVH